MSLSGSKQPTYEDFYQRTHELLNGRPDRYDDRFLNLGYSDQEQPERNGSVSDAFSSRWYVGVEVTNAIRLVRELLREVVPRGAAILDIGSGRGGTLMILRQDDPSAVLTGIDRSVEAVEYCRKTEDYRGISFDLGDAQGLPYECDAFDVVVNVESSHCYEDIRRFVRETHRVLKSGGQFLYTDALSASALAAVTETCGELGFRTEHSRDISANVVQSCEEVWSDDQGLGSEGSEMSAIMIETVDRLRDGRLIYVLRRLRK